MPVQSAMPEEDVVDLNPLIDVITLLIVFFLLAGKLSQDARTEQITVPPTKTAAKMTDEPGWERVIVNVFGNTQTLAGGVPMCRMRVGTHEYENKGMEPPEAYKGYSGLRQMLNSVYDRAEKYPDPKPTGMILPKIVLEIRADADTQYRVIQEIQQIASDTIDPDNNMQAKVPTDPKSMKSFVSIDFTARTPTRPVDVK